MWTLVGVAAAAAAARAVALTVFVSASSETSVLGYRDYLAFEDTQTRSARLEEIDRSLAERLAPFDGQFYLDIARRGYRRSEQWPHGNFAFLPLYPTLLWVCGGGRGAGLVIAVLLQIAMSAVACVGLWIMAERIDVPPWAPVGLILAWPAGLFGVLIYTESVFFLLSILAPLLLADGRERAAGIVGFLAGMTRTQGILVSVLFLSAASERGRSDVPRRSARLLCLTPIAGFLSYLLLLGLTVGSPLAAFEIQAAWGRGVHPAGLFEALLQVTTLQGLAPDLFATILGLLLLPVMFLRLPLPLALYGAGSILLPLSTGTPLSMCRFLSVAFPLFLAIASLLRRRPWTLGALVLAGAISQGWFARRLAAWTFCG
jgi:hypothetical protein